MRKLLALILFAGMWTGSLAQTFDAQSAAAQTAVTNLQAAAEAKVAADAQRIADLNTVNNTLASQVSSLTATNSSQAQQIGALTLNNTALAAQVQTLQSTFTWRGLEWVSHGINCNAQVGGSGKGVGLQNTAPGAYFAITPTLPAAGTANYFDCYYTWDAAPDETKTHFRYSLPWTFPTQADANASQALEMEVRQSLKGGLMAVWALQLNFSGKTLRIWDHTHAWFSSGTAQARFIPGVTYTVTLDGHRDSTTACYDAITINTAVTPLSYCYPMWNMGWRPMLRVAGQLDGNGAGTAYKVNRGTTDFVAW